MGPILPEMRLGLQVEPGFRLDATELGEGAVHSQTPCQVPLVVRVGEQSLNAVPETLFGEFLERPSWDGERGPEGFFTADAPGFLPSQIVSVLVERNSPLLRFPGGTDVDYTDWHVLVDGASPQATPDRPRPDTVGHRGAVVTNRFGWHEYFALRELVGARTLVTLNFRDALIGTRSARAAALHHAGLLAYLALPVGAPLPEGMPDWPSLRAENGHPEPFPVEYVQIGNEWFAGGFTEDVPAALGTTDPEAVAAHYLAHLHAYIDVIREILPDVPIIIDAVMADGINRRVLKDEKLQREVRCIALHSYAPWEVTGLRDREDRQLPAAEVTDVDWWYALQAMPGVWHEGVPLGPFEVNRALPWDGLPYQIACTEWNWVGWWGGPAEEHPAFELNAAGGLGAASYLHALLRAGDRIDLAIQSMLLGENWVLASLRQPKGEELEFSPQGDALKLFRQNHGTSRMGVSVESTPAPRALAAGLYAAPLREQPPLPMHEVTATAEPDRLCVHLINRHHELDLPVEILAPPDHPAGNARIIGLQAPWERGRAGRSMRSFEDKVDRNENGHLSTTLPPRSVAVVRIDRKIP